MNYFTMFIVIFWFKFSNLFSFPNENMLAFWRGDILSWVFLLLCFSYGIFLLQLGCQLCLWCEILPPWSRILNWSFKVDCKDLEGAEPHWSWVNLTEWDHDDWDLEDRVPGGKVIDLHGDCLSYTKSNPSGWGPGGKCPVVWTEIHTRNFELLFKELASPMVVCLDFSWRLENIFSDKH